LAEQIESIGQRMQGPLRLAIAGKVKAGKSTLLNAMLGEELAATDAGECTQIVTWYQRDDTPRVTMFPFEGEPQSRPFRRSGGVLEVDLGGHEPATIERLEIGWPTPRLRELTIADTPGISSISTEVSARTHRFLAAEQERPPAVDAVVYLLRHTHASDAHFLESFHDDELAHGSPMNVIGILSRADEIGSCRMDSLEVADRVASRYQADGRLRRLCPIVIPVAGLLGFGGATLRETEFRALAQIAALPGPERGQLLLTADRFCTRFSADVTELERAHLLQRFGLFGARLSVEMIAAGVTPDATTLAQELVRRSGLDRLRGVLARQFTQRSRVLKARSALTAVKAVLAADGCTGSASLRSRVEQIEAGTHAFEELRLLIGLRSEELGLSEERREELDRILGGSGHDPARRLGLDETAGTEEITTAALAALQRWQRVAEHPISSRAVQLTARGACRTLEGIVATTHSTGPVTPG
jgi:hypothetical protein